MVLDPLDRAMVEAKLLKDPQRAKAMQDLGLTVDEVAEMLFAGKILEPDPGNPPKTKEILKPRESASDTPSGRKPRARLPKNLDEMVREVLERAEQPLTREALAEAINRHPHVHGQVTVSSVQNSAKKLLDAGFAEVVRKKRPMTYQKKRTRDSI